jgi:DNA-directed RNA polymerase subunit M/transcription elongation factor TFIIS
MRRELERGLGCGHFFVRPNFADVPESSFRGCFKCGDAYKL